MINLHDFFTSIPLSEEEQKVLQEYADAMELLSSKHLNMEFNNKDQKHAALVMSSIFHNAKKQVRIFTGSLNGDISNISGYLQSVRVFLDKPETKVEVIFEEKPNIAFSKCYKLLKESRAAGKDITFRILTDSFKQKVITANLNHFMLGDDNMFRYETDKKQYMAFCNFDDPEMTKVLDRNFRAMFINSTPLD